MDRTLRNTLAVLVITAFTALGVFGTVQLIGRVFGTSTASASTAAAAQASGSGQSAGSGYGYGQSGSSGSGSGQSSGSSGSSGAQSSSGSQSSVFTPDPATGLYTCPATGCTSSSCHALQ